MKRRDFIEKTSAATSAFLLPEIEWINDPPFQISLAEFSLASSLFTGQLTHMEFPAKAVEDFGIYAVEHVTMFWRDKATDKAYLQELKQRTEDLGVQNVLIMVDMEGELGASDSSHRMNAVESHYKWIDAANYLGCQSIRVNIDGDGLSEDIMKWGLESYHTLLSHAAERDISVIIENHMTISTDPDWLSDFLSNAEAPNAGCLPDFGNFTQREKITQLSLEAYKNAKVINEFDKYEGVKKLMPYAVGVSAKTAEFSKDGSCMETDFTKMMPIVIDGITNRFQG
jgi:hypothetical protein